MSILLAIIVIVYIVFFTVGFISYVFNAYGLYSLAKKEKESKAILAWIPGIDKYILGRIAFKSSLQGIFLVALAITASTTSTALLFAKQDYKTIMGLIITTLIASLMSSVYTFVAHYKVFEKYSKSTIIMTILDVISGGLLGPFFIFAIRDNKANKLTEKKVEEKV